MIYYRQKILLNLISTFGGRLNSTDLQKLLFLFTQHQGRKSFDFVPYSYGCFSFQANKDLHYLYSKGLVEKQLEDPATFWIFEIPTQNLSLEISQQDSIALKRIKNQFSDFTQSDLIKYTYLNFPYYAIKSLIAERVLNKKEFTKVQQLKKEIKTKMLFTIGYEGLNLEQYLNKLIINDVKLLCDIRKNPISRKYGFSKSQLQNSCESVGIKYIHIPELGIDSEKRKGLDTIKDYQKLFCEYEKIVIKNNLDKLNFIFSLVNDFSRVSLTCFEKDVQFCHRSIVAKELKKLPNWNIQISNL